MTDSTATPPPDDPDPSRDPEGNDPALGGGSALSPQPPADPGGGPPPPNTSPGGTYPPPGGGQPPPPGQQAPPGGSYPPPPPGQPPTQPPASGGPYPPPHGGGYPPPPPSGAGFPPPPPPPPGAYPPPGGYPPPNTPAARPAFSPTDAVAYGWRGFTANIGPLVVIGLVLLLVSIASNFLSRGFDSVILDLAASVLSFFLSLLISLGLIRAALAILDGGRPSVELLLSTRDLGPYFIAALLVSLIVGVGVLLCLIPGLIAGFLLQFFGYAIVDRKTDAVTTAPQSSPTGAIRASFEVVTANVGPLILLALLCLVLNIAGALLCGIGLLVSMPVTAIAIAYAWRYFSGGRIAEPVSA